MQKTQPTRSLMGCPSNLSPTATEAVSVYQSTIGKVSQTDSVVLHHARIEEFSTGRRSIWTHTYVLLWEPHIERHKYRFTHGWCPPIADCRRNIVHPLCCQRWLGVVWLGGGCWCTLKSTSAVTNCKLNIHDECLSLIKLVSLF